MITATGMSLAIKGNTETVKTNDPIFKISLAEWSLNRSLFAKKMDNLDFAIQTRAHGIEAVEYVNQFFKDGYNAPNCATHFAPYSASHFAPNCATFHNE